MPDTLTEPVDGLAPGEGAQERGLAVSDHAGDADDLALAGAERDVGEAVSAQPVHPKQRRLVGGGHVLGRERGRQRAPDDHGEEVGVRDLGDGERPAELSVAQDGDAIGDLAHLAQPVRDVDDGRSRRGQRCGRR